MTTFSNLRCRLTLLAATAWTLLNSPLAAIAQGDLIPPGPPGPTMKTLQQVEPRTPVDAINTPGGGGFAFVIGAPGSYYLTGNVEVSGASGILISSDGVTLDLNGFEIRRKSGTDGLAISITANRCVLRNGLVHGFHTGIRGLNSTRCRLTDLTIDTMTGDGILVSAQAHIENCLIENVAGTGITAGIVSHVRNCTVRTTGSHGIKVLETSMIEGNILNNCLGDSILADNRCTIRNNTCDYPTASGAGIHLTSNQGESRVEKNNITRRAVGIQIDGPDNYLAQNTVRGNTDNYLFAPGNFLNLLLSEIPETIDWPATVTLAGTLKYSRGTNGVVVRADNVTIDLGGHALVGGPGSGSAILVPNANQLTGFTLRNGTVRDWDSDGIRAFAAQQGRFENLHSVSNGWSNGFGMGIRAGNQCLVKDCTAAYNAYNGITVERGSSVIDCVSGNNGRNGIVGSIGATVRGCAVYNNSVDGIQVFVGSSVQNCTANNNNANGISVDEGSTVSDSSARNNGAAGILMSSESTTQNCAASGNQDGIKAATESTVRNCTAARNKNDGIEVGSNCLVTGNNCDNNGRDTSDGAGIHVTGWENRIDDNRVAKNDRGILIDDSAADRNWVVRNTARFNNSLNYVIPAGNRVGIIAVAPVSGDIAGDIDPDALGAGTLDPWANFSY